jgi:hypothetical protein
MSRDVLLWSRVRPAENLAEIRNAFAGLIRPAGEFVHRFHPACGLDLALCAVDGFDPDLLLRITAFPPVSSALEQAG